MKSIPIATKELSLNGLCSYSIEGLNIRIDVAEITNNRQVGNVSGTLTLELWALDHPYEGVDFAGHPVASVTLGELRGQHCIVNCSYSLSLGKPPEGTWNLVLMLREWENGAYVTRDFINFPQRIRSQYRLMLSLDGLPAVV